MIPNSYIEVFAFSLCGGSKDFHDHVADIVDWRRRAPWRGKHVVKGWPTKSLAVVIPVRNVGHVITMRLAMDHPGITRVKRWARMEANPP